MSKSKVLILSILAYSLLCTGNAAAQNGEYDVFIPISKYMTQGDADKLSAWFADNLEISLGSTSNNSSKNQARQIIKSFFDSNQPRSFTISHTAGKKNMKYAIGTLKAGGDTYQTTIFVSLEDDKYKIQLLKIENIR